MTARPALLNGCASARIGLALACGVLAAGLPGGVRADDGRYSLGAVQPVAGLEVVAGAAGATWLGFYNIDGTSPTTVELSLISLPQSWQVTLSTDASSAGADVLALTVEPSSPTEAPQECGPLTTSVHLSGRGYVCAETAWLRVLVPKGDGVAGKGEVTVRAAATWPGQGAFMQEREFVFGVRVVDSPAPGLPSLPLALAAGTLALLFGLLLGRRIAKSQ